MAKRNAAMERYFGYHALPSLAFLIFQANYPRAQFLMVNQPSSIKKRPNRPPEAPHSPETTKTPSGSTHHKDPTQNGLFSTRDGTW